MNYNKVIFGDTTIIDLTNDTVTPDSLFAGIIAHDASGSVIEGTLQDRGAVNATLHTINDFYQVPEGYHNGNGIVKIDSAECEKIIPENIKLGITILGVVGTGLIDGNTISLQANDFGGETLIIGA